MFFADPTAYAHSYSLAPAGGAFLVAVGVFLILGAFVPRLRQTLAWIGLALAAASLALWARELSRGLPAPDWIQIGSLVLAIALEIVAIRFFAPRWWRQGERSVVLGILVIVGLHFIIMFPAFGPAIVVLAMLCVVNAGVARARPSIPIDTAWFLDGLFKLAAGAWMLSTSPLFR